MTVLSSRILPRTVMSLLIRSIQEGLKRLSQSILPTYLSLILRLDIYGIFNFCTDSSLD